MSEYESMDANAADPSVRQPMDYPPPPVSQSPGGGPQSQADSHQAVARLPDLGRSGSDMHNERSRRRRSRQREGLDPSVKLYVGTVAGVVVVIAAMLFFWSGDKKTDVSGTQEMEAWEPKIPHPDAPTAPPWQSPVGETPSWQTQDNLVEAGQPDASQATVSWDNAPRAVEPYSWTDQPKSQPDASALSGPPRSEAWGSQSEIPVRATPQNTAPQNTPVTSGQTQWGAVGTQAQSHPQPQAYPQAQAYPQPQAYPAAPSGPEPQQSAAAGQIRPNASPWNGSVKAVPIPTAVAPSRPADLSPRTGRYMGTPPAASSLADRQPGAYNGNYQVANPMPAYRNPYQPAPRSTNDPTARGGTAAGNSYQSREWRQPAGSTAYGAAPTTRQIDPAVVARRDDRSRVYRPGDTGTYRPEAAFPQAPAGATRSGPAASYRTEYPGAIPSTSPRSYPNTYPATNHQGTNAAPAATYPAPTAGASTQYPQSGTARLNGVIGKPPVRTTYDSTRSSLY